MNERNARRGAGRGKPAPDKAPARKSSGARPAPRKGSAAPARKAGERPAWTEKPGARKGRGGDEPAWEDKPARRPRKDSDGPSDKPARRPRKDSDGPSRADKPAARRGAKRAGDEPAWVDKRKGQDSGWEDKPARPRKDSGQDKPAARRGAKRAGDEPAWVDKRKGQDPAWEGKPRARKEPEGAADRPAGRGRGRSADSARDDSGQSPEQRHEAAARRVHARRDQQAAGKGGRFTREETPAWQERPAKGWEDRGDADDLVYGRRPVLETLRAGRALNKLFVLAGAGNVPQDIFRMARDKDIPVVHSDKERLDRMARGGNHQGVVAQVATRDFVDLESVLVPRPGRTPLILALDGIQDPHNLGALLRTAEAAGVQGVVLSTRGSVGLTASVSRASAGADQYLRIARTEKLDRFLKDCAKQGYAVVGADMSGKSLFDGADLTGPTVLVLGAEGEGLSNKVAEACSHRLRLPMLGQIESLNVSVSGALFLYEAVRQRELNKVQHSS